MGWTMSKSLSDQVLVAMRALAGEIRFPQRSQAVGIKAGNTDRPGGGGRLETSCGSGRSEAREPPAPTGR